MTIFKGLSAFPITPADENGAVIADDLDRLLARIGQADVQSVGLLGSTGTYVYLTRDERRRAVEIAADALGRTVPLIVGVGALRTDEAVELARDAQRAGADALLLAPVSYTPLTEEEVYRHFLAVTAATDLPLCIYNNPGTTHFTFSTALLERLAGIPAIKAVKMPLPADGDFAGEIGRLRDAAPDDFLIGYSGDWGCAEALLSGANTWYSVIAGLLPSASAQLAKAAAAGDTAEARRIDGLFQPLWRLFKEFGSLRVVYAAAHILSLTRAEAPRPILPLSEEANRRIAAVLEGLSENNLVG